MATHGYPLDHIVELWPTHLLTAKSAASNGEDTDNSAVALVVLNSPIANRTLFHRLYQHSSFRIYVDGGANRVYDLVTSICRTKVDREDLLREWKPDTIHGDLDSLRDDVKHDFKSIGVDVSYDSDQYSTDFGKSINETLGRRSDIRTILVLGSLGGRVDQGLGLLHEIYREQKIRRSDIRFWLFSEASVSTVLTAGTSVIHTPLDAGVITKNTGVLPVYGPAIITMQGFEWDVDDWSTEMGGQVSTSNHIVKSHVTIKTNHDVLFTVETDVSHKAG